MKILLVDDHEILREGIKRTLEQHPGIHSFSEVALFRDALDLVFKQEWDLAFLALFLAGTCGLEILQQIKKTRPSLPVLIVASHPEEQYARRVFRAGGSGYIPHNCTRANLLCAVQKVIRGGRYVSPGLAESLAGDLQSGGERSHEVLSDREVEVMRWIALGKTVGEISSILSLSQKTISTYRARILEKLQLKTSAEIVRYAIRNALVD